MDRVSGYARGDSSDVHNWVFANFLFCVDSYGSNRLDLMAAGGRRRGRRKKKESCFLIYNKKGSVSFPPI